MRSASRRAAKAGETRWLGDLAESQREAELAARLDEAITRCREAQAVLAEGNGEKLARSDFHYLEVLREVAGGERAELLGGVDF